MDTEALAQKHGFSRTAVEEVVRALRQGRGAQAQFNHPELGGMGQWQPGMLMIGDMFNSTLKARVESLIAEVAGSIDTATPATMTMQPMQAWWPQAFGSPSMQGDQNGAQYAYFPARNRLVILRNHQQSIYDTSGHTITGVSQQQSNAARTLTFQTKRGTVTEHDFDEVPAP